MEKSAVPPCVGQDSVSPSNFEPENKPLLTSWEHVRIPLILRRHYPT